MLFKSLEFKNAVGQKVKVIEIPVLEEDSPNFFMIQFRLKTFISAVHKDTSRRSVHSFREYLKRVLKWKDYEHLFNVVELKNNA